MKVNRMIFRLAVAIALLIGLGDWFQFYPMSNTLIDVHIVVGIIVLVSGAFVARASRQPLAWVGVLLVLVSGVLALSTHPMTPLMGVIHLVVILVGIGLIEMRGRSSKLTAE